LSLTQVSTSELLAPFKYALVQPGQLGQLSFTQQRDGPSLFSQLEFLPVQPLSLNPQLPCFLLQFLCAKSRLLYPVSVSLAVGPFLVQPSLLSPSSPIQASISLGQASISLLKAFVL